MARRSSSKWLLVAAAFACGCVVDPVDFEGKACSVSDDCPAPLTCGAAKRCVAFESLDASAQGGDASAPAPDAGEGMDAAEPGADAADGVDASTMRDAASSADGARPLDAAMPVGDGGTLRADAAALGLDAAAPGLDAAAPGLDAAAPGLDAAAPGLDAAAPGLDAAAPGLDAGAIKFCMNDSDCADLGGYYCEKLSCKPCTTQSKCGQTCVACGASQQCVSGVCVASCAGSRAFSLSPAVGGKDCWDLDTTGALNLATPGSWTLVPSKTFSATVKAWGGGGGGSYANGGLGGGAGYATMAVTFTAGQSYTLIVGGGGEPGENTLLSSLGGAGGFGGGGAGGSIQTGATGQAGAPFSTGGQPAAGKGTGTGPGGGGGGLSGLFSAAPSQASAFVVAGGGGGGAYGPGLGGAGGGTAGGAGTGAEEGMGGTQKAGGSAGVNGTPGGAGFGGGGAYASGQGAGGGGGGGWYGGGGGGTNSGGGGGGSGYVSAIGGVSQSGSGTTPANAADVDNHGAGQGATSTGKAGAPGRVILR